MQAFLLSLIVPPDGTTCITTLIPLQCIGQHTREGTDTEVIRSKRTEHQTAAHGKAVQIARDIHRCHGHLLLCKVVTGRIVDVPTATQLQVTACIERMGQRIRITHGFPVELALVPIFTDAVAITQAQ